MFSLQWSRSEKKSRIINVFDKNSSSNKLFGDLNSSWIIAYQNGFASCMQDKAVNMKRDFVFAEDRDVTQIAGLKKHLPIVAQDGLEFVWNQPKANSKVKR